jgi:hypothetical protein
MAVMKPSVEMPFSPLVDFDNKDHLTFDSRSVELQLGVWKHRWRWKPVANEANAAATDSAGADDGCPWNTTKMQRLPTWLAKSMDAIAPLGCFFSCERCSYVSMNEAREVRRLDAQYPGYPTTYMAFADATLFFPKVSQGVLAFVVEGTFTTKRFMLSTKLRALAEWLLPISIWCSLVFQPSTRMAKYRWHWKLHGWRPLWVPITGGTDIRLLSWKQKAPNAQLRSMTGEGVKKFVLLPETQRRGVVEPDRVPDWREPLTINKLAMSVALGFADAVYVKTSLLCLYASCDYQGHARRVLSVCAHLGDFRNGGLPAGYTAVIAMGRNVSEVTSLVDMYDKCGTIEQAWVIFNRMVGTNILPWSTMIRNFALNALLKKALALFSQLQRETFAPDRYAPIGVFSACGRLGAAGLGDWASQIMDSNDFWAITILGTTLIDMYAKFGRPKIFFLQKYPPPMPVREYVVAVIRSDSLLPTTNFIQSSSCISTAPGSENQWDSSPGLDMLVEVKTETLRYNNDPDFLLDLDRENKELHSRSLVYDFDTSIEYGHKSLLQNSFYVVLMVFGYVSIRKWRDTRRQMSSTTESLAGPRKFRYYEMTTATFHDCSFHDGRQWVLTWPWLQIRFAWVRISGVFGRFKDNRLGLGSWTLWRSTWQELMALGHASRGNGCQNTLYMVIGGNGSWSFWKVHGHLFCEWVFDRGRSTWQALGAFWTMRIFFACVRIS